MASETHELLVQVRPEGIDETTEGLDEVGGSFEKVSDETGRTAGLIGGMSDRLRGFAGIIVATLTTLAAGIATQVPVIGESASALGAIIDAIALKIDDDLRPSLSAFNRELFTIADEIARSEGTIGDFARAIGRLIVAWDLLVPLSPLNLALMLRSALNGFTDFVSDVLSGVRVFTAKFMAGLEIWRINTNQILAEWQINAFTGFETFFALVLNTAKTWANDFVGVIEQAVNTAIKAIPSFIRDLLGLSTISIEWPFETQSRESVLAAGRQRRQSRIQQVGTQANLDRARVNSQLAQTIQALQNSEQRTTIEVNSRILGEEIAPLIGEGATDAGATTRTR